MCDCAVVLQEAVATKARSSWASIGLTLATPRLTKIFGLCEQLRQSELGMTLATESLAQIFIASVAADFARKVTLHPIDTMATRLQYDRSLSKARVERIPLLGDAKAIVGILSAPGEAKLYRGLSTSLAGAVPVSLVYMPTYELTSQAFKGHVSRVRSCVNGDVSTLRRAWGVATVREFARHRVSRLCFIGAVRGQGAQAVRARSQGMLASWAARSPAAFSAFTGRVSGALSARRGVPRRA